MQKKYKLFFIVGIVCAVGAALVGVYAYNTVTKMVPVIVATQDIQGDEAPASKTVAMGKEPVGSLNRSDAVTRFEELKGQVAKGYISAGSALRKSMFMPVQGAGLAARLGSLGDNMVAISVPPTASITVGNGIKRGDTVAVKDLEKDGSIQELSLSAKVLDIPNSKTGTNAVALAVTVEEANKISKAKESGLPVWCELLPPSKSN